jgi:hypothetical protein
MDIRITPQTETERARTKVVLVVPSLVRLLAWQRVGALHI